MGRYLSTPFLFVLFLGNWIHLVKFNKGDNFMTSCLLSCTPTPSEKVFTLKRKILLLFGKTFLDNHDIAKFNVQHAGKITAATF